MYTMKFTDWVQFHADFGKHFELLPMTSTFFHANRRDEVVSSLERLHRPRPSPAVHVSQIDLNRTVADLWLGVQVVERGMPYGTPAGGGEIIVVIPAVLWYVFDDVGEAVLYRLRRPS